MPNIDFVLPHWAYWAVLTAFPLIVFAMVRIEARQVERPRVSLPLAYLFWATAGFIGMHRFYVKSVWGLLYIPLFLGMLWLNTQARDARDDVSSTRRSLDVATSALNRAKTAAERGRPMPPAVEERHAKAQAAYAVAEGTRLQWERRTQMAAGTMGLLLVIDALLLPGMVRRRDTHERQTKPPPEVEAAADDEVGSVYAEVPAGSRVRPFVYAVDQISRYTGRFAAYWSLLAVFAYYYEVLGRYVFNSPTNWVHESQFLMFGMMYMLAGAYAFRDDSHVRVDVVYLHFSRRGKAIADIVSSIFFFIFTLTILVTGWHFAADAMALGETSFTEWGIQYWPVKLALPVGAALIVLQGFARLLKDIAVLVEES